MAVKAQVTAAPVSCPLPAAREGAGRSSGAGPGTVSRPDPVAGINRDTMRAPAADAGRRQARAAKHLAGVPGRRLMPAAQPTKSPGTPPGDDDLDAAAAHPGRRQTSPRCPPGNTQREAPGHRARGHAARRPGERHGLPPARQHHGHKPRTWPVRYVSGRPGLPPGKPADRAGKTGRSLASPSAQPVPSHAGKRA
jgi:hypothetical protein